MCLRKLRLSTALDFGAAAPEPVRKTQVQLHRSTRKANVFRLFFSLVAAYSGHAHLLRNFLGFTDQTKAAIVEQRKSSARRRGFSSGKARIA